MDNDFTITLKDFHVGFAPVAHLNPLTEIGAAGSASAMVNADVLTPGLLTQGPGLSNLTSGTQAGAITELVNFIMDKAVAADVTYGIATTKLHKISSIAITNTGIWPHAITSCTGGSSVANLRGSLYYFFNKASGGDIGKYDLASSFDDHWGSTVPTGAAAIQSAPHPVATKEDIMLFGNGRYAGVFLDSINTLSPNKLDFGTGCEVADVAFHANQWHIAVNNGVSGTNRNTSQIYQYDGAALSSILSDETAVGVQRIGFILPQNGVIYVCYQDLTSTGGYILGYVAGREVKPLRYFTGSLPTFAQKTIYKNLITFLSSSSLWTVGAPVSLLPVQSSQLASGGYSTLGALAAPFGTPIVASTDGGSNFRLAKFSGYDTASSWRSIVISVINGRMLGKIDEIIVQTKALGASARADLKLEANQGVTPSSAMQVSTTGKTRHVFKAPDIGLAAIEDFRLFVDWSAGSAANDCAIRKVIIRGHYTER
jgi:hypothetical protein